MGLSTGDSIAMLRVLHAMRYVEVEMSGDIYLTIDGEYAADRWVVEGYELGTFMVNSGIIQATKGNN